VKRIFFERTIEFLKLVDFEKSEIRREHRIVFLCGGQINEARELPASIREALLRHLPARDSINGAQIILAERATEALPGSNFNNLLDLEEYLSAVVDGVILIVESAGSICELGAFVKTPNIASKLVVLISNQHDNATSFIKLGALKYLDHAFNGDAEICPFHWEIVEGGVSIQAYVLTAIVKELSESLDRVRPRGKFDRSDLGDRIFLTLSICHLLRGAKITEIKECYRELNLEKYEDEIIKHLSVLEICKHLVPVSHGKKKKYFVPKIEKLPLKVAFTTDTDDRDRNVLRWIGEISGLVAKHEPTRMKIFQEHQDGA
jgi:hypothetical protein